MPPRRALRELTKRADSEIVGLRVGIKNGGCAGQSYTVEYAHEVKPTDEVVEDKGVKILVDPKAVLFLLGTEMDYKADKMQAQFVFNNPNQISRLRLRRVGATDAGEDLGSYPRTRASRRMHAAGTRLDGMAASRDGPMVRARACGSRA